MLRNLIHLGGRLLIIALIAGLALGATYYVTKEPIAAQARLAAEAARNKVFQGDFEQETAQTLPENIASLYHARGMEDGYVMEVEASGYGGRFLVTVGVTIDGTVTGISVGDNSETPGLGKNVQQSKFMEQFNGKNGVIAVKKGGGATGNEVDAITGATISTQAVTDAVNAARAFTLTLGGEQQ